MTMAKKDARRERVVVVVDVEENAADVGRSPVRWHYNRLLTGLKPRVMYLLTRKYSVS